MRRVLIALGLSLVMPMLAPCQTAPRVAIRAGKLIDGKSEKPLENVLIGIEGDRIASVVAGGAAPAAFAFIDLSQSTLFPGFMHTHTPLLPTCSPTPPATTRTHSATPHPYPPTPP